LSLFKIQTSLCKISHIFLKILKYHSDIIANSNIMLSNRSWQFTAFLI